MLLHDVTEHFTDVNLGTCLLALASHLAATPCTCAHITSNLSHWFFSTSQHYSCDVSNKNTYREPYSPYYHRNV